MELNENTIKSAYKLMEMLTKGYQWYHDTPEKPFYFSEGSIWLINPETNKWMIELKKSGDLWYYYETPDTFSKYLNMEVSDFESFIKIWIEDALERGVVSTLRTARLSGSLIEDALERGVVSTFRSRFRRGLRIEDALERGVVSTEGVLVLAVEPIEDALERGVVSTFLAYARPQVVMEDALERGVTLTLAYATVEFKEVEEVLKNGKKWN